MINKSFLKMLLGFLGIIILGLFSLTMANSWYDQTTSPEPESVEASNGV